LASKEQSPNLWKKVSRIMNLPDRKIAFSLPYVTGREMDYLAEVVRTRHFAGNGPFTQKAQALIEGKFCVPKVLLTHSCTAALEMSALLLDIGPGDEVIMPSYTFCSTASAFARTGAKIVFCDIDPATMMVDVDDMASRISPLTRALVPIHYGGLSCDIDRIAELARHKRLTLVEDAAQAFDTRWNDKPLGTFGRLGCISFHETKNLHAGLCGALFINDKDVEFHDRAVRIWERGTNRQAVLRGVVDKYTWTDLGSSFYPTEFQAAFLLAQLEAMVANKAERQVLRQRYEDGLRPLADQGAFHMPAIPQGLDSNYHACFVVFDSVDDCERVRLALKAGHIAAYIGYVPLHTSPMGLSLGNRAGDLPKTEDFAPRVLRLPFHNDMTPGDVDRVTGIIRTLFA
jgi:dTDP-4-amino-4,6-dideoxygalactose transaminase